MSSQTGGESSRFVVKIGGKTVTPSGQRGWSTNEEGITAWAKNDHLGFEIAYLFAGIFHKLRPDLLIRLTIGTNLIVEMKGENTSQDETKRRYLEEWVRSVNVHGGFGLWQAHVCLHPSELPTRIQLGAMASMRAKT